MMERDCKTCAYSSPFGGANDNGCTAWGCEYINKNEAIQAWKEKKQAENNEGRTN